MAREYDLCKSLRDIDMCRVFGMYKGRSICYFCRHPGMDVTRLCSAGPPTVSELGGGRTRQEYDDRSPPTSWLVGNKMEPKLGKNSIIEIVHTVLVQ